jgi:hypothetical protein
MRTWQALTSMRSRRRGSAVIVVLVLLAIVIAYACGNARTLNSLKRSLGLIEMRQTNSPAYWQPGQNRVSVVSGPAYTNLSTPDHE